jgi:hypothetical protein
MAFGEMPRCADTVWTFAVVRVHLNGASLAAARVASEEVSYLQAKWCEHATPCG